MSIDISSASGPRHQPPPPAGVAQPASRAAAPAAIERPEIAPVKKAEIRFDAEAMRKSLQDAIERLNEQMRRSGQNLSFNVDKAIDRVIITVKNSESGEVVRQIPNEVLVRVAHNIEDLRGLLLNEEI